MTYNNQNKPQYVETAGKITILTALTGVLIFAFIFILNIGQIQLHKAEAANTGAATTTLTVLNTPPQWIGGLEGQEEFESSTNTPTNSGVAISWVGTAADPNGSNYYMLICDSAATPTAVNSGVPQCSSGVQWGVSTSTLSSTRARVSTTTTEAFAEQNFWWAWVCDDDPVAAKCNSSPSQGLNATNSSPFYVNHRPVFTAFSNNGPKDPNTIITFTSSSSDPDTNPSQDNIVLIVCSNNTYSTTTNLCGAGNVDFIASTSANMITNATATKQLASIMQDANYPAWGYVYDQHKHSASGGAQGTNVQFTVNNVAPYVLSSDISLNNGVDMTLTNPGGQTSPFTLDVTVNDANSCKTVASTSEVTSLNVSVLRSGVGTTSCNNAGQFNANSCYNNQVATSTWNMVCTASTTSCTGPADSNVIFNCTFPLWFIADPTSGTSTQTAKSNEFWVGAVAGIDNNNATGSMSTSTTGVEVLPLLAINLLSPQIAYDNQAPGTGMTNLTASTSLQVLGNTGIDQLLGGDSMCRNYSPNSPCANAASTTASSTIIQSQQRYATSALAYASGQALNPTSTPLSLLNHIPKPTSTSTAVVDPKGTTYWGIFVPGTISLSGSYTGQNTFSGQSSPPLTW